MLPTERISYSPIAGRAPLRLPDGARMAVWVIVNIEEWDAEAPMPRTVLTPPAGGSPSPDIPNWAWHEYGNRVGFWRLLEALDELSITAALAVNGTAVASYEPISRAALDRGWEFMGHNQSNSRPLNQIDPETEGAVIKATFDRIEAASGTRPRGWLSGGLIETWNTLDHLIDAGGEYVCDWTVDDQPFAMDVDGR